MSASTVSLFPPRPAARVAPLLAIVGLVLSIGCGGDIESRMAEVRALQDVGQFSASVDELREILAVNPDLAEGNYRLGLALVQTGEPSRAVWPLQKAAESSEYQITAGVLLASTHFQTKNYDESIRAATRVLEADPDRQAAMRIRANANLTAVRLEESLIDTTRLVELYPDDYAIRALHATVLADLGRLEEAEREHDLVKEMGEKSDDPEFQTRACLAPAVFAKDVLKDDAKARVLYDDCAQRTPTDPMVLGHIVGYYDGLGEREIGTQLIRAAVAAAPESLGLRATLANRLHNSGDAEAAEQVLKEAVESFGSAAAWNVLANYYRRSGQPGKALEAIEKVIEVSGGASDQVSFTHADILLDLNDTDRAEEVARTLERPTYAQLIRGRILLLRGDPAGALAAFEKGIRAWPNNAGARFLAGLAARDLGDYDRAISELREAVRANVAETEAALELARIHLIRGSYQNAVTFANMALKGPGGYQQFEAYLVAIRAMNALGQHDRSRLTINVLKERGHLAISTAELALLEREIGRPETALEAIRASGLDLSDPANEVTLQQSAETLADLGRVDDALLQVDEAIARAPERGTLYELRGLLMLRGSRYDPARIAFEKALELDPRSARAKAGLAAVAAESGDLAGAIALFDEASVLAPHEGGYAYSAAQLTLASGDIAGAEARLRDVVRQHPDALGARNDLAWLLAGKGEDLDFALKLALDANRRRPAPEVLDTLGWVYYQRGEMNEAVAALEQAAAGRPDSASIRYRLALAVGKAGEEERSRVLLEGALAAGTFPEAEEARQELARLDRN
jgi:tetratricopeptide (TPR) repeat protein